MSSENSPSFQYEDAPDDPPSTIEPLVGSPSHHPHYLDTDTHDDALELQPSPPQTPSNALSDGLSTPALVDGAAEVSGALVGDGTLSVDVQDAPVHPDEDGMQSVAMSPVNVVGPALPIAPAVTVPRVLPTAAPVTPPTAAVYAPAAAAPAPISAAATTAAFVPHPPSHPPPPTASVAPHAAAAAAVVPPTATPTVLAHPVAAAVPPPPPPPPPPVDPAVLERAARRAAFFKGQAQRSQLLATEIESMSRQNEREESFWSSQEHRYSALLQRAEMADRTTRELVRFFQMSNKAVTRTLEELNVPLTVGSVETGSLKEACSATEQVRHTLVAHIAELRDKHLNHCLAHVRLACTAPALHCAAATAVGCSRS